ncbi:MAG TPA: DsbA family protein [Usitatibacter sp.]|nr:DsbA family protein [Usitatibacter sp.]
MNGSPHGRLVYVADPLCSWCYGFGPELEDVLARHPEIALELVMGGLRAGNTEPMSPAFRDMLRGHWDHVAQLTGLEFSDAIFEREGFVYDTEPPCRAVVAARSLDPRGALALMKAIQQAFYREGRDVTAPATLASLAAECGYDAASFSTAFESPAIRAATGADFARARSWDVTGFPTLALARGDALYLLTAGFATGDVVEERLAEIERRLAPAEEQPAFDDRIPRRR